MSKHTPGPWYTTNHGLAFQSAVCAEDPDHPDCSVVVARVYGKRRREADARLIAKAPSMYDALNRLLSALSASMAGTDEAEEELGRVTVEALDLLDEIDDEDRYDYIREETDHG